MVQGNKDLPTESGADALLRSGLKLTHLRMLVAIEDYGQISAAAEAMHISQPAASRMLSEMETIVKAALYERVARGVVLTPFGEALARRARKIVLELREASREMAEMKTGKGGSVFIGSVTAPAISLAVPAIRKVTAAYPGIEINVQVETSNVLARELLAARHDFIIGRIPDDLNPRQFIIEEIGVEKACLIVRNGHPLLERPSVSLADLPDYEWVFQPPGTLLRRTLEDIFIAERVPLPDNIVNTSSLVLTAALVCNSDAIAPVAIDMAKFFAGQSSQAGEIRILNTDFDIGLKPYALVTTRERALPPSARLLYDTILEESRASSTA
ncbi:LysR family transcriptional regulator [Rhizobiaceae bacterium n13]|uniref:LysR family transcriptional regulator n=1 Tax=Ferirhizobium litorale TaxID=2927786 RepID=A0AAE3Q9P4_9HYPH|nr:LysR family transcriptional regulator [Fererhizobium litorale]MDI7860757.1 LysR family transcriptional regulator [Fererhizobium litorale]MDI7920905.1 LysR family transcriptional regulator [Fererhizobium litorale]